MAISSPRPGANRKTRRAFFMWKSRGSKNFIQAGNSSVEHDHRGGISSPTERLAIAFLRYNSIIRRQKKSNFFIPKLKTGAHYGC